jgi:hypothetical protein
LNQNEWAHKVISAVGTAARGDRSRLVALAQSLADTDTATESLVSAGYGDDTDGLMAMVAMIVESKSERPEGSAE